MNEKEWQDHCLASICYTSAECARRFMTEASLETLKECLKIIEGRPKSITLRKMIEARIRKMERTAQKDALMRTVKEASHA